jgi:DegV family protein with EDD domain
VHGSAHVRVSASCSTAILRARCIERDGELPAGTVLRVAKSRCASAPGERSERTVAVVTDAAASLPAAADQLGIQVVPLRIAVGEQVHRDHELTPAQVADIALRNEVTTAAPSPGEYLRVLNSLAERDAVILTVARTMSASYHAALIAAGYQGHRRVSVVDTETAAGGQGLVALAAARAARAGANLDEVVSAAQRVIRRVRLVAFLESLDHLARSGRVPKAATLARRALGVRALFELSSGQVRTWRPALSLEGAISRIVAACRAGGKGGARLHAAVLDGEAPTLAAPLTAALQRVEPGGEIYPAPFSSVMVAHTGPGLSGLAWWWEPPGDVVPPRLRARGD